MPLRNTIDVPHQLAQCPWELLKCKNNLLGQLERSRTYPHRFLSTRFHRARFFLNRLFFHFDPGSGPARTTAGKFLDRRRSGKCRRSHGGSSPCKWFWIGLKCKIQYDHWSLKNRCLKFVIVQHPIRVVSRPLEAKLPSNYSKFIYI